MQQECIPVGCVPPAAVAVPGGVHQTPREQTPPQTRHTPREHTLLRADTPRIRHLPH